MKFSIDNKRLQSVIEVISNEDKLVFDRYMHLKDKLIVTYASCVYANNNYEDLNSEIQTIKISQQTNFYSPEIIFYFNFESVITVLDNFIRFFETKIKPLCSFEATSFLSNEDRESIYVIRNRLIEHFSQMQLPLEKAYKKHFKLSWSLNEIEREISTIINGIEIQYILSLLSKYEK